ncbi:MAG: chemotaxis protein CheA [Melioribacteraceae bacterium]|nr:chemotaxis protein CheA [Melioribacteraceae bacterium]
MNDYSLLNDPDMSEIFESFIVETKETLEKLDLDLVKLESSPDDADLLNEIFRSFHTVKGTSGFLGLVKMQSLTHRLEDILNKLRRGEAILTTPIMDGILKGYDTLGELLEIIENNKNEEYESEEITKELEEILKSMVGGKSEIVPEEKEELSLSNSAQDSISTDESDSHNPNLDDEITDIDLDEEELQKAFINNNKKLRSENKRGLPITAEITSLIEELPNPVNNEISASNSEIEVELNKNQTNELKTEKKENTDLSPENIEKKLQSKTGAEQTIRVDVDRLDELLNLVSELVLGRNRLSQINTDIAKEFEGTEISRNLGDTARQIDLLTTELQLAVMKTRMIKIGKVFNRFPRLVRDLSKETNKEIELVIKGEKTELDKTLIEEINDPLVHLIRNSVDHGIESPEERTKAGKKVKGTITLSAEHEGNHIIISITDDGKGIDPEKIITKAIAKGIISKEKAEDLSRQEIFNLIFAPGFSTAENVTNISGRGVGMDVVKTNVSRLRGIIEIDSEINKGTRIDIKLPLTLAIIQGLLVKIIGETIILPLSSVVEVVKMDKSEIHLVNGTECIKLRDRVLPLINIENLLYHSDTLEKKTEKQFVVVIGLAEKRYGIKVDDLVGQKEIVIKSLGKYLGNIEGIAGSTIMGDGKVVMIADIAEIINKLID